MATALKTSTQSFIEHADVQPSTPDSGLGSEAQSWFLKGIEHARSEEWHEALAIFERVLELDADNATAHYNRAVILLHLQNIEEAVSSFRRALALNAGFQQAYIIGGMVLVFVGRYDEAFVAFDRALARWPNLADALLGKGAALFGLNRHAEASSAFNEAATLMPKDPHPIELKAATQLAQGNLDAADAEMEQLWLRHTVPEMHRTYARLLEQTARQLQRQGRKEEARRYRDNARRAWARSAKGMWKDREDISDEWLDNLRRGWSHRGVSDAVP